MPEMNLKIFKIKSQNSKRTSKRQIIRNHKFKLKSSILLINLMNSPRIYKPFPKELPIFKPNLMISSRN